MAGEDEDNLNGGVQTYSDEDKQEMLMSVLANIDSCSKLRYGFTEKSIANFKKRDKLTAELILSEYGQDITKIDEWISCISAMIISLNSEVVSKEAYEVFTSLLKRGMNLPADVVDHWCKSNTASSVLNSVSPTNVQFQQQQTYYNPPTQSSTQSPAQSSTKASKSTPAAKSKSFTSAADNSDEDDCKKFVLAMKTIADSVRVNQPQLRIDCLRSRDQNANDWFDKFDILTRKWSEEDKGIEVAAYFEDIALQKYKLMSENKYDYNSIKSYMIRKFQSEDYAYSLKSDFYSAKQKQDEDVEKFGHRLLKYINESPENQKESMRSDLASVFRKGCELSIQKQLCSNRNASFRDLWAVAKNIEKCNDKQEELSLNQIKETTPVSAVNSNSSKCYNCQQDGHFSKDCPAKKIKREPRLLCYFCGKNNHLAVNCNQMKRMCEQFKNTSLNTKSQNYPSRNRSQLKCTFCNRNNHTEDKCRLKQTPCPKCNQIGHLQINCPSLNQ